MSIGTRKSLLMKKGVKILLDCPFKESPNLTFFFGGGVLCAIELIETFVYEYF
jgi:hypothetical protein